MFVPLLLGNAYILRDPQHVNCPTVEIRMITCIDERGIIVTIVCNILNN